MLFVHKRLLATAALFLLLAAPAPVGAQIPAAPKPGTWQDLNKLPQRALDPATFKNNALRVPDGLKTHQFTYEYKPPQDRKHLPIYNMLRERQILERVQAFLTPIYLPNAVKLETAGCDGRVNAQFWRNVITVCYEYFDWIHQNTPKMATAGLTPNDAMIGPTVDVFLHEVGHCLLQLLDIPLLGNEEDAADFIATFLILQFSEADARRLIMGASFIFGPEALQDQERTPALAELAARHSLPAQRFFNRLCMAYGKDPALYADAVTRGMLPARRANHCAYEYSYISDAFRRLILPYTDHELVREVRARSWFEFESAFADVKPRPAAPQ